MHAGLDAIDVRILEQLQVDAAISTTELAERVGLSQSPCWRRIQRLRDEGYIKGQVVLIDHEKVGIQMQVYAQLKISSLDDKGRQAFIRAVKSVPEIVECYSILGERDVMIKVVAPNMKWYQDFVFKTVLKLPGVQDISSIMTLSEMKHTTAVPIRPTPIVD